MNAGTAEFLVDMDKANASIKKLGDAARQANQSTASGARAATASIREFGEAARGSSQHAVSGVQATSAALRVLEGGITNNLRAAERFAANFLGLGSALRAVFPIAGGIAFAGILAELTGKAANFIREWRQAPFELEEAFRTSTAGARLNNDELALTNARLDQQIAKLQGRRENTLAVALREAVVEADKLADSLDHAFKEANKALEETSVKWWQQIFQGKEAGPGTLFGLAGNDLEDFMRETQARVGELNLHGQVEIRAAALKNDPVAQRKAQDDLNRQVTAYLTERQKGLDQFYQAIRQKAGQAAPLETGAPRTYRDLSGRTYEIPANRYGEPSTEQPYDPSQYIRRIQLAHEYLELQKQNVAQVDEEGKKRKTDNDLEAARAAAKLERPLENKLADLRAELEQAETKLAAAGLSEGARVLAAAQANAVKAIEEVNKAIERQTPGSKGLAPKDQQQIRDLEVRIAQTAAEEQWRAKLAQTTANIRDQVQAQELLTQAIGRGYEAVKKANVEVEVMRSVGAERYNDTEWMSGHVADVQRIRADASAAYEAKHREEMVQTADSLRDQIGLEQRLIQIQAEGAAVVRLATFAYNQELARTKGVTEEVLALERERFAAERANEIARQVAQIHEQTEAVKLLAAAQAGGQPVIRAARVEAEVAQARREGDQPTPGVIGMGQRELQIRSKAAADYELEIATAAGRRVNVYTEQLQQLKDEERYLRENLKDYQDTEQIVRTLRDIEEARRKIAVEQELAQRSALSGLRAFFLEMQRQAKSAAEIVYDSLNSALDRVSDNAARALTGQKTEWAKAFRDLGTQALQSTIRSGLQRALGSLGARMGIRGKPDFTPGNPGHVIVDNLPGGAAPGRGAAPQGSPFGGIPGLGGLFGGGALGGGIFSLFGGLFGGGGAGFGGASAGAESVTSSFSAGLPLEDLATIFTTLPFGGMFADGGVATPDKAYIVGDDGPEILTGASGRVLSNTESRRLVGRGSGLTIGSIDARGADLGAGNRIRRAIEQSHREAVATAVRAVHDRSSRVPANA